jgi:hypothetical protein
LGGGASSAEYDDGQAGWVRWEEELMAVHALKTWPQFYEAVVSGEKTFEVRRNDRGYQVGDILILQEYRPDAFVFTGRETDVRVTYLLQDERWLRPGFCVMGIVPAEVTEQAPENEP